MDINQSVLLVIDVQGKLASLMDEADLVYSNMNKLISVANTFSIPILWTEQAPHKIGATISRIADCLTDHKPIIKETFSAYSCAEFQQQLQHLHRRQVIIAGIEAHVCIYQTARDLKQHGYDVYVVDDAVSARSRYNRDIAVARMRQEGITIINAEMLICDLLKTSAHPQFKAVMAHFKK